jgi:hypothetical protein
MGLAGAGPTEGHVGLVTTPSRGTNEVGGGSAVTEELVLKRHCCDRLFCQEHNAEPLYVQK